MDLITLFRRIINFALVEVLNQRRAGRSGRIAFLGRQPPPLAGTRKAGGFDGSWFVVMRPAEQTRGQATRTHETHPCGRLFVGQG